MFDDKTRNPDATLPLRQDGPMYELARLSTKVDWVGVARERHTQLLGEALGRENVPLGMYAGKQAADVLERLIALIESDVRTKLNAYGPARWLWYIRRLPDSIFGGERSTTLGYDSSLAEALSWGSSGVDFSLSDTAVLFRVDEPGFRHICRFVGGVKLLADLHAMYRRIGKGGTIEILKHGIDVQQPGAAREAVDIYDTRHERSLEGEIVEFGAGMGLAADAYAVKRDSDNNADIVFLTFRCGPVLVPVTGPDRHGNYIESRTWARHALTTAKASILVRPFGATDEGWQAHYERIRPLLLLAYLLPVFLSRVPYAIASLVEVGYFAIRRERFIALADDALPEIVQLLTSVTCLEGWPRNASALLRDVDGVRPDTWPLRIGGVLRSVGDVLLVDVSSLSRALLHVSEIDRAVSELANSRAGAFEDQVQEIVNGSSWRPDASMAALRRRALRRRGRTISDIDAIGTRDGCLLLISCKSVIYDRDYDKGEHRVIRNVQATVDEAVARWREITMELLSAPGDNFDFSRFRKVISIVCTPFIAYSDNSETLEVVEGNLRRCASISELKTWLNTSHP